MFRVTKKRLGPPKSAPFINSGPIFEITFFEDMRCNDESTMGVVGSMVHMFAATALMADDVDLVKNCRSMFTPDTARIFCDYMTATPGNVRNPLDELRDLIDANEPNTMGYVCDLINAAKKKELTPENVKSYFTEKGTSSVKGAPVASFINSAACFFPDDILEDNFRNNLSDGNWNDYHSSRVSTGKVLLPMIDMFADLGIINEEEAAAIEFCAENSHNLATSAAIPKRVIGYANVYLETTGKGISNWYQGKKCEAEIPYGKLVDIKRIFKKYDEINNMVTGLDDAQTIADVKGSMPQGFWG